MFIQAVLAGEFLSGADGSVKFHEVTGWTVVGISVIQVILVSIGMRSGFASLWWLVGSVMLLLGESLQVGSGYARFLEVHVPLGVIVFGGVVWQAIAVFQRPKSLTA